MVKMVRRVTKIAVSLALTLVMILSQFMFNAPSVTLTALADENEGEVTVSLSGSIVTIANGIVSLDYNLSRGTYNVSDLIEDKVIIRDAFSSVHGVSSKTVGYVHTYVSEDVSDELGVGKRIVITSVRAGNYITLKTGFALYEGDGMIAMSSGLVNTSTNTFRLRQLMPVAGGTAFAGFDVNTSLSMLSGVTGDKTTVLQHSGSMTSANNGLLTFGATGANRSLVLGGLTYNKYPKWVSFEPGTGNFGIVSDYIAYLNLGVGLTEAHADTGEVITHDRGGNWTYSPASAVNADKYHDNMRSITYADSASVGGLDYLQFSAKDLDPAKDYSLGMSWWDIDNTGTTQYGDRIQSLKVLLPGGGEQVIFSTVRLNSNRRNEPPQRFSFTIPKAAYTNGTAVFQITRQNGYNCVASDMWLTNKATPGGVSIETVPELPTNNTYSEFNIRMYSDDPLGMQIEPGVEFFPDNDTYYMDFMTQNPFEALEKYAFALKDAQHIDITPNDFPTTCLWYIAVYTGGGRVNTSAGAVAVMQGIKDTGFLNYSKSSVRLVPDYYGPHSGNGDETQQSWWSDARWARTYTGMGGDGNGQYVAPYLTTASWCGAVEDLGGIPMTYFQSAAVSDDYGKMYPERTVFGLGKTSGTSGWVNAYDSEIGLDFSHPDQQEYMRQVYKNLKDGGLKGIMFDYPWTAWKTYVRPNGQYPFYDPHVTTGEHYRTMFKLAKEGLGPGSYIDERCSYDGHVSDIALGYVDSQRTETDTSDFNKNMATKTGLRWYKNRVVTAYDLDSKDFANLSTDGLNTRVTMSYVISGRLLLANDFRTLDPKATHAITRIYPQHTELKSPRPVDAFVTKDYPHIYDFEVTPEWHQVTLYNGEITTPITVSFDLAGDTAFGALGLEADAEYYIYDFWNNSYIGRFDGSDTITQNLRANETRVLSIRKVQPNPQVVSTDRHIFQGVVDMEDVSWNDSTNTLSGLSHIVKDEPYKAYIKLPDNKLLDIDFAMATTGVLVETELNQKDKIVVLTLTASNNTDARWYISFKDMDKEPEDNPPTDIEDIYAFFLSGDFSVNLAWSESVDDSGDVYYNVYKSETEVFTPGPANLVAVTKQQKYKDLAVSNHKTYYYKVIPEDMWGNLASEAKVSCTVNQNFTVNMISVDYNASNNGLWRGKYGQEGYELYAYGGSNTVSRNLPSYVPSGTSGISHNGAGYSLSAGHPNRDGFLEQPSGSGTAQGGLIFRNDRINYQINTTDGKEHVASIYLFDNNGDGTSGALRTQSVWAEDDAGNVVSERVTIDSFGKGKYLTFSFSGRVRLIIKVDSGPNSVMSAVFFNSTTDKKTEPEIIEFTSPNTSDIIIPATNPVSAASETRSFSARVLGPYGELISGKVPSISVVGALPDGVSFGNGTLTVEAGASAGMVALKASYPGLDDAIIAIFVKRGPSAPVKMEILKQGAAIDSDMLAVPAGEPYSVAYAARVIDQYGNIIANRLTAWSSDNQPAGFSISGGVVTLSPGVEMGTYNLTATDILDPGVRKTITITIAEFISIFNADGKMESTLVNLRSNPLPCILIAAVYSSDNKLVHVQMHEAVVGPNSSITKEFDIKEADYPGCTFKAFAWDENYVPLYNYI